VKIMSLKVDLNKLLIAVLVCWIILAIFFGFTDLEISKTFVNRESIWANIGKYYGEGPGYGIIAVAIAIIIGSSKEDIKKQKTAAYVILIIGVIILSIAIVFMNMWFITFGGGLTFILLFFLILTKNKDLKEYKTLATVILLLTIINPLIFVQITKIMCGRVRFNNLASDYSNYTPWFLPPGPISGLKGNASFPSGHTAIGWMFLPIIILVKDRELKDPVRIIVTAATIAFGLFLGISRIVTGDHYASDVLFSTAVAVIATILLYKRYYLNKK
jgi:undecaprenyl-diphosphatase